MMIEIDKSRDLYVDYDDTLVSDYNKGIKNQSTKVILMAIGEVIDWHAPAKI